MKWRPIDTAPRDGTRVLICEGEYVGTGLFSSWARHPDGTVVGLEESSREFPEDYQDTWEWSPCDGPGEAEPTHWMPLPDPAMTPDMALQRMAEKMKADAADERARKAALASAGTCPECEGEGQQGGQFCGGYWTCEACGGTGNFDPQIQRKEPT